MKLIDGSDTVLGRLAVFVAKESLRGEEVNIVNCDQIIITGNKETTKKEFEIKRGRVGSGQTGPKHHATSQKIVKRAIRGMLPDHRVGRGKEAFKRIKCYSGIPKEFEGMSPIKLETGKKIKFSKVKDFIKNK